MPTVFSTSPNSPRKVIVSRLGVRLFNAQWPGSRLDPSRHYWFEFDDGGNLVDTDVPEHTDGPEAIALSEDARAWLNDEQVSWDAWHLAGLD